jgi:hypothetical protein
MPALRERGESMQANHGELGGTQEGAGRPFLDVAEQFGDTLDALRDLHASVNPATFELEPAQRTPGIMERVSGLPKDKAELLATWLEETRRRPPDVAPEPRGMFGPRLDPKDEQALTQIFGGPLDPGDLRRLRKHARRGSLPGRRWFLNGSLLTMAIGALEVLVAGARAEHYTLYPKELHGYQFRLDEIQQFASVEDAADRAIARAVDSFGRQPFEKRLRWFGDVGVPYEDCWIDEGALREVFQRRHVVVHNAGRVTRSYLEHVAFEGQEPPQVGDTLDVSSEYLAGAFDQIDAFGSLLAFRAWRHWNPNDAAAVYQIYDRTYELVLSARWAVVRKLAAAGREAAGFSEETRWVFRVNEWLAYKRLGEFELVRNDVEQWDTSALDDRFRMFRAALLDDLDGAFRFGTVAVRQREIGDALDEFPLLDEMRDDPRFEELRRQVPEDAPSGYVIEPLADEERTEIRAK